MTEASGLRVAVGELLGRPGERRTIDKSTELDLGVTSAQVSGAVAIDVVVEAVLGGLTVTGTLTAPFVADCRRCLERIDETLVIEVHEIFEAEPTEGETYPIDRDHVDLEPLVRDAVLPSLPLAPLCVATCIGPDPERYPAGLPGDDEPRPDPRWAALDVLREAESDG